MAALQSEPAMQQQQQDNSSPNVTLTIRLIMQGKVSIKFLKWLFCFVPPTHKLLQFSIKSLWVELFTLRKITFKHEYTLLYPHHQVALASKLDDPLSYANNI